MKTGMQKFTKICLTTALVTCAIGCLLCGVGALFGGFRQLEGTQIRGIPFRYYRYDDGGVEFGFGWDDEWDDGDWTTYQNWNIITGTGEKTELNLTAGTLKNLTAELGACDLHILRSDNDHVQISMSGVTKNFRYVAENNDTLRLVNRSRRGLWNWSLPKITPAAKVYLYLPEGVFLDNLDIELGAGSMDSVGLRTREAYVDIGAGTCTMEGLTADGYVRLQVGAGRITLQSFTADKADMDIGAGELYIERALIRREADLDVGMGSASVGGVIAGDLDADCGMGNLTLELEDAETDHNYEIDCAMGNVVLGDHSYSGLGSEQSIHHGSSSTYDIDCSMGNVDIRFAK